jgi:hypothetical protein
VGKATTDVLTNKTLTSPTISGAVVSSMGSSVLTSATAQASTSGTSIDFTGIPSWVKRVTVMFNGVSTNGGSPVIIQIGSGSITTSGYISSGSTIQGSVVAASNYTSGFGMQDARFAAFTDYGIAFISLITNNTLAFSSVMNQTGAASARTIHGGGTSPALGGALDRVRITTVNGADTFDAGSINIMYE